MTSTLIAVASMWIMAVMLPGPNFLITAKTSAASGRWQALAVAAGITCGTFIWGLAGFLGVTLLFVAAPWLFVAIKMGGGLYLLYLGFRMIRSSFHKVPLQMDVTSEQGHWRSQCWKNMSLGLMTNLANPKAAIFTSSLFATLLPPHPAPALGFSVIALMMTISFSWYSLVILVFSSKALSRAYLNTKHWVERMAGGIFALFGLHLLSSR
ncbi:LysE family transporter [Pokkaliibacter sp. CJK22405]|uniref:LysE family transporter n=1 Tax=Pokkaliibacter sp. CJK22405 TaxID=3384615 RepID=UPI0039854245